MLPRTSIEWTKWKTVFFCSR